MIKIGYQGDIGSNSEEAASKFIQQLGIKDYELIPLISSKNVIKYFVNKEIDYAVLAVKNSITGTVVETAEALIGHNLTILDSLELPIHHCLFIKQGVSFDKINTVASHIQALKQTREHRLAMFPNLVELEVEDTAVAAIKLANDTYPDNYAVICRKNAGLDNGLVLLAENIEDDSNNRTTFFIYKQ